MAEGEEEKKGDQEALSTFDWESHSCKIVVFVLVIFAIVLLGIAIILRLIRFGSESNPFFYIFTLYLALFIAMLVISIIRIERIITYFTFLSTRKGVGFFMIFIGLLLFDWNHLFEMAVSILLLIIGLLYIIYGFKVGEVQPADPTKADGKNDVKKDGKKGSKYEENKDEELKRQFEEERKRQYGDNYGANAGVAIDLKNQKDKQNAAPPSYQPKGGDVQYQQDTGINRPDSNPRGASNYPAQPVASPNDYDYESQAPSYQPRGQEPVRQHTPASYGQNNSDEEDDESPGGQAYKPGGYAFKPEPIVGPSYNQRQEPYRERVDPEPADRKYRPPPPDEAPVQVPDKLKKFKDINDLHF
jgi:hypothetical protein